MISLIRILAEGSTEPKALLLAGAPASGKGTILRGLNLSGMKTLNLDDEILQLAKEQGFSLNQKNTDASNRSSFMKAMAQSTKNLKNKRIPDILSKRESFILDGTSASSRNTLALRDELEGLGYEVMMLYVYTDLETSLKRNEARFEKSEGKDRSLMPAAVLGTWKSVTQNWELYQREFGDSFVSVSSLGEKEAMRDIEKILQTYVEPWKVTDGVPKDEKAQARSDKSKAKLKIDLDKLLNSEDIKNIINGSVTKEQAQSKINKFLR